MAWRVIATDGGVWHVDPAAERRANARQWQLMLSFRAVQGKADPDRFWAPYPLQSVSKGTLFAQAESIRDDELRKLVSEFVT